MIRELESGIFRGCMDYGRLYQGKYIPPERTDGLLSLCEEESVIEEAAIEELDANDCCFTVPKEINLD